MTMRYSFMLSTWPVVYIHFNVHLRMEHNQHVPALYWLIGNGTDYEMPAVGRFNASICLSAYPRCICSLSDLLDEHPPIQAVEVKKEFRRTPGSQGAQQGRALCGLEPVRWKHHCHRVRRLSYVSLVVRARDNDWQIPRFKLLIPWATFPTDAVSPIVTSLNSPFSLNWIH